MRIGSISRNLAAAAVMSTTLSSDCYANDLIVATPARTPVNGCIETVLRASMPAGSVLTGEAYHQQGRVSNHFFIRAVGDPERFTGIYVSYEKNSLRDSFEVMGKDYLDVDLGLEDSTYVEVALNARASDLSGPVGMTINAGDAPRLDPVSFRDATIKVFNDIRACIASLRP